MSLSVFRGELALCVTIVALLVLRIIRGAERIDSFYVTLLGSLVALWFAGPWQDLDSVKRPVTTIVRNETPYYKDIPQADSQPLGVLPAGTVVTWPSPDNAGYTHVMGENGLQGYVATNQLRKIREIFTGMLVYDPLTVYFRAVLLLFAVLFTIFTRISGIPDREAAPDFYVLMLGATLGMCMMASANHMLMVFLGVEMASVPSYAMAGLLKGRRQSSEAALKYAVYGAGTAGIMLYGISLLAGILGSVHIPTMASRLLALVQTTGGGLDTPEMMVLALGALMLMVGLAFKLSAVPFHFWCPDVFEGASAEVNAFLSIASKAAALALLVRVAVGMSHTPDMPTVDHRGTAAFSVADDVHAKTATEHGATKSPQATSSTAGTTALSAPPLESTRNFIVILLSAVAIATCTFGNLAAYGQNNIKRMLAYSTIAHAGYMIMPVAAAVQLLGADPAAAERAISSLAFYVGVYLFMNLGAFAIVAFIRNAMLTEKISDYAGLIRRSPVITICFATILVSLIGLPPLAGFAGKFAIFRSLVDAKMWTLLVVAGINTAISLYYYLRVVKIMTIDPEPHNRLPYSISFLPGTFVVAVTAPVLILGIFFETFNKWALAAASHLLS